GSLKDRLKPMRGLKNKECSRKILEGYVVHYNYCKPHSALGGRTPATAAGIESLGRWNDLIVQSIRHKAKGETNGSQKAPVVIAG
ncbi:MAG: integrase core domain-containing protein, partial [Nitrososphaerales archaeon]